jgi:hypothetical protein
MKKDALPYLVAAAILFLVGLAPPVARALSNPISELQNTTATCDNVGSADLIAPSGASTLCIENTSATCVQLGGSTVSGTGGLAVGLGCSGGQVFCADAKRLYCVAASSVTVDVIFGSM